MGSDGEIQACVRVTVSTGTPVAGLQFAAADGPAALHRPHGPSWRPSLVSSRLAVCFSFTSTCNRIVQLAIRSTLKKAQQLHSENYGAVQVLTARSTNVTSGWDSCATVQSPADVHCLYLK